MIRQQDQVEVIGVELVLVWVMRRGLT